MMKADVYNTNPDDWYCGDSLCKFNTRPGQHTNGGCTCIDRFDKKQMVMAISKLAQERKQLKARADLFPELVEALGLAMSIARLPSKEDVQNFLDKLQSAKVVGAEIASIAADLETIHDVLTKARALQPDKRANVAEQNRRAAESQETPEGK